jgi:hypothetical protein
MREPKTLNLRPPLGWTLLGGALGALISAAIFRLAAALGVPGADVPRMLGAAFSADAQTALLVGHLLDLLLALVAAPVAPVLLWNVLPGRAMSLGGAALKGLCWGGIVLLGCGLLIPLWEALFSTGSAIGLFALGAGPAGLAVLAAASFAYGLAVALTAWAGHGLSMLDTLGWSGIGKQGVRDGAP